MKKAKSLWIAGLGLLIPAAGAVYWYTVQYIEWNVPLYGVSLALLFGLGAAGFALLSAAGEKTKKRTVIAALLGGLGTVAGIFAVSFVINVILFHEKGARFACVGTSLLCFALALYGVLRLKKLTGAKLLWQPLLGVLLAFAVLGAGLVGIVPRSLLAPDRYGPETLRKAAEKELDAATEKLYGSDALQREDGSLTVAFIGGSLTEGTITYQNGAPHSSNAWTEDVLRFLEKKYPLKTLRAINAGKGGTNSAYGAARFGHDVEPYAPDLLFIEFSVNDAGSAQWLEKDDSGRATTQLYLEYMLRRCLNMKKEPAVIYLHTPYPTETDTDLFLRWKEGADLKTALCAHYGVPVIDIYETLHKAYKNAQTSLPLTDWLVENGWYNRTADGGVDVHPNPAGYRAFYSAAVVGALENDWDALICQPKHAPVCCEKETDYLNGTYSYVECTDPRLTYADGWRIYHNRLALWLDASSDAIPNGFLAYPHFTAGIAQAKNLPGASFSYETDADELDMALVSSVNGLSAAVFCDGKEAGKFHCGSVYGNMDYPAGKAVLPGDGQTHPVTVQIDDPSAEAYLFRFGYLIEFRYK
ncbi:MAG: hypothetical protein IJJ85_02310 [Clostridia bacterium]|nr:hypothetical protein [Clostridia bacterium]